jgi:hypothetical protein
MYLYRDFVRHRHFSKVVGARVLGHGFHNALDVARTHADKRLVMVNVLALVAVQIAFDAPREICVTRFATVVGGVFALGHAQEVGSCRPR